MSDQSNRNSFSGDEAVGRVKMALAEMGYGDASVWVMGKAANGTPTLAITGVPDAVAWQAGHIVNPGMCWSCWSRNSGSTAVGRACLMGDCANLGPARPPRELLMAPARA